MFECSSSMMTLTLLPGSITHLSHQTYIVRSATHTGQPFKCHRHEERMGISISIIIIFTCYCRYLCQRRHSPSREINFKQTKQDASQSVRFSRTMNDPKHSSALYSSFSIKRFIYQSIYQIDARHPPHPLIPEHLGDFQTIRALYHTRRYSPPIPCQCYSLLMVMALHNLLSASIAI